jgi:hypothetical protein
MDSSITIKPLPGARPRSHAQRDPVAVREAVDTELDPAKTVTAATDGGAKHHHNNNNGPHHEAAARDVVIDPKGQEALFSAIDVRAEHVDHSPNQALMRQRAYQQQQAHKRGHTETPTDDAAAFDRDPHADIEA